MPTPTPITQNDDSLVQQLTMEELYDALMREVEPELTFDAIPYLPHWYSDETERERAERMTRYEKAFALVEERMTLLVTTWKHDIQDIKNMILKSQKDVDSGLSGLKSSLAV